MSVNAGMVGAFSSGLSGAANKDAGSYLHKSKTRSATQPFDGVYFLLVGGRQNRSAPAGKARDLLESGPGSIPLQSDTPLLIAPSQSFPNFSIH
jgi:hypothetical protein